VTNVRLLPQQDLEDLSRGGPAYFEPFISKGDWSFGQRSLIRLTKLETIFCWPKFRNPLPPDQPPA